jgi:hypothetical protein
MFALEHNLEALDCVTSEISQLEDSGALRLPRGLGRVRHSCGGGRIAAAKKASRCDDGRP